MLFEENFTIFVLSFCYPDFSLTSLTDKTIRKSSDYRLAMKKMR